jgi:hypothetical protein
MIQSVFDRLARLGGGNKDREAEALIVERMRAVPDAAYNLVEAVVVQELVIKERDARISELESQLARSSQLQAPAQPTGFAQGRNPWGRGSVPQTQPQMQHQMQPQQYAQPQYGQQPQGGSFLRTAAGAAVGVAGGMLLANSLSGMFAGGHGGGNTHANQVADSGPAATPSPGHEPSYDTNIADDGGFDGGFDGGGDF